MAWCRMAESSDVGENLLVLHPLRIMVYIFVWFQWLRRFDLELQDFLVKTFSEFPTPKDYSSLIEMEKLQTTNGRE